MIFESEANYPKEPERPAKAIKLTPKELRARKRVVAARGVARPRREANRKHCALLNQNNERFGSKRSFVDMSVG